MSALPHFPTPTTESDIHNKPRSTLYLNTLHTYSYHPQRTRSGRRQGLACNATLIMPITYPLRPSTHTNLPVSVSNMPRPGTTTTTTTSSGSRLLSRLGSGSAEKWGDSSVDTPQPTSNSATPAIHGNISKSKNGVLSATTSTSSSTGIRPLITGSSISSANHSSEVNKTQESLTWSPSPER